ncbi:leucine-rich repeat and guanylate kinase domain-containing protein-like [Octopus vulgaris]|uniref:Leucine-rich repeat and guanylate kinase domain-containing protein-like n=1 Tax=Octopus vulgaris TaxID=6645 RepID=A0AA36FAW9_OCTVU|nr:leucine-rich repeat and guanylate kinase domain-containing protein-like [Octopus vulgaris]
MQDTALEIEDDTSTSDESEVIELTKDDQVITERICKNLSDLANIQKSFSGQLQYSAFYGIDLELKNMEALKPYSYLQKIDVSNNQISNLSPLINLEHLIILNVSNNLIYELSSSYLPNTLKHADFSRNLIEEICDFQYHPKLTSLYLDYNKIKRIKGLHQCERLHSLSLAYNMISRIENLECLPLQYLNLSHNYLKKIENLETLVNLREVNLSSNSISSLNGLKGHHVLEVINVNNNQIKSIDEILHINGLPLLRIFTILKNPIEDVPNCSKIILFHIQRLLELNGSPVSIHDKVEAINMFSPSLEVVTSNSHMIHTMYAFLASNKIRNITLANIKEHYPIIVLVGPEGSGNRLLAMRLADDFPNHLGFGITETTRIIYPGEVENKDFNFITVNAYKKSVESGEYLVTNKYIKDYFGLKRTTLENLAEDRKACITHMQLEAMISLQNTVLMPQFILTLHTSETAQHEYMQALGVYTESDITKALQSREELIEFNQNHAGSFCHFISTDSLEVAYQNLQNYIKQWLSSQRNIYNETRMTPISNAISSSENLFVAPERGIVEEESVKRRRFVAKQIVRAVVPTLYEKIERSSCMEIDEEERSRRNSRISALRDLKALQNIQRDSRGIITEPEEVPSDIVRRASLEFEEFERIYRGSRRGTALNLEKIADIHGDFKSCSGVLVNSVETNSRLKYRTSKPKMYDNDTTVHYDKLSLLVDKYDAKTKHPDTRLQEVPKAKSLSESHVPVRLGSAKHTVVPPIHTSTI